MVLRRSRPSVEELFRRHAVSLQEAERFLLEALSRLESLHGVVPGAGNRLCKWLEAACRGARPAGISGRGAADYGPAFEAAAQSVRHTRLMSERARAATATWVAGVEASAAGPLDEPADGVDRRQLSTELLTALLERSRDLWKVDPQRSLFLAQTALRLLDEPSTTGIPDPVRSDLEARGHAFVGNAHRILNDYRSADREFVAAQSALGRGTEDPRERALVLTLLATLRRSQSDFAQTLRLLQQAAAIYRWTEERHLEGQTYWLMAIAQSYAGQPELSIPLAQRAAELVDADRHPEVLAGIEQNMAHFLCAAGRPEEARRTLARARRLAESTGVGRDFQQLRWVEGQIALALGEREEGERILLGVRDEFIAVRNLYDTALVSLELAAEYLDQGRTADAKRLAEETLPIFQSLEIHRESLAALIAVQRAIELETATAGLVRELLESLRRGAGGQAPRPEKPS